VKLPVSCPVALFTLQLGEEITRSVEFAVSWHAAVLSAMLNPVPDTVTVVAGAPPGADPLPTRGEPVNGLSEMAAITKKVADAVSLALSDSVT
jgi:hypothetical protein